MEQHTLKYGKKVVSELVKLRVGQMDSELCSDHFPSRLFQPGGLKKKPAIWQDDDRPPLNYQSSDYMSSTNLKIIDIESL
jgi:hypothetical protein